jgi:hypothetical protein
MLNYLARRAYPTRYGTFLPTDAMFYGEDEVLRALEEHPPDCVVVFPRPTTEYGQAVFGLDYARHIADWLRAHYRPVALSGPPGSRPFWPDRGVAALVMLRTPGS